MSMYQKLKKEKIAALKNKNDVAKRLIPYIINMAMGKDGLVGGASGAEPSDAAIFDSINKTISDNKALLENKDCEKLRSEISFLEAQLPSVMNEVKLREVMKGLEFDSIGVAMKLLSENYPGRFDKPMASKLAREFL